MIGRTVAGCAIEGLPLVGCKWIHTAYLSGTIFRLVDNTIYSPNQPIQPLIAGYQSAMHSRSDANGFTQRSQGITEYTKENTEGVQTFETLSPWERTAENADPRVVQ